MITYEEALKHKNNLKSYVKNNNINLYSKLLNIVKKENISFSQVLYDYIKGIVYCPCGNKAHFSSFSQGYRKFCSLECAYKWRNNSNDKSKEKRIESYKKTINSPEYKKKLERRGRNISKAKRLKNKTKYEIEHEFYIDKFGFRDLIFFRNDRLGYGFVSYRPFSKRLYFKCLKNFGIVNNPAQMYYSKEKIKESKKNSEKLLQNKINYYNNKAIKFNLKILDEKFYEKDWYEVKCLKCNNIFKTNLSKQTIIICSKCYPKQKNKEELKVYNWLITLDNNIKRNDRLLFSNKIELDFLFLDRKLAIEYNGYYKGIGHTLETIDINYHLNKTEKCEEKGIQLLHIFADDWNYKQEIVKSLIKSKLKMVDNRIYARKTKVIEIDSKTGREFFNKNHLQGAEYKSKIYLALEYNNEIISVMSFGQPRFNKNYEWELVRFANKLNTIIIGGASKLFYYFIKKYNPNNIISYADRCYSNGNMYYKLGFKLINKTKPGYWYLVNGKRENRMKYQKHKLKYFENYSDDKTEKEIMRENGFYQVPDCGQLVFEWKKNDNNIYKE